MYGSDRQALSDVRECQEDLPNVLKWSGSHPDVREWSGVYPKCPGVVGRPSQLSVSSGWPSRMFGSGREALTDVRKLLGGSP